MLDRASHTFDPGSRSFRSTEPARSERDLRTAQAVLRSLSPLLDLAFGVEGEAAFPDEIAALVEMLRIGPLGLATATPHSPNARCWASVGVTTRAAEPALAAGTP